MDVDDAVGREVAAEDVSVGRGGAVIAVRRRRDGVLRPLVHVPRQGRPEEAKVALSAARDVDASSPFCQAATEALKGLGVPPK